MTYDSFKIYVDQLRGGKVKTIDEVVPSDFLSDDTDTSIKFAPEVIVNGECYLADPDSLVLRLHLETTVYVPCKICNQSFEYPICIESYYATVSLEDVKSAIYDLQEEVREAILLEVPFIAECNGGKCPQRKDVSKYLAQSTLKSKGKAASDEEDEGYQPFANVDFNKLT